MPSQGYMDGDTALAEAQQKRFQKHKWQVLFGTFLLVLIVANAVIWSQAQVYQSQTTLHFSYSSPTASEFGELAERQISLHQQRLKNNNVLSLLVEDLDKNMMISTTVQSLSENLIADANLAGRIITLKANGSDPSVLKPMLDAWVKIYLSVVAAENQSNSQSEVIESDQQLQLLEEKIAEQQQVLQLFASEHNITSLQRDENRALSQTKNLAANLDQALADKAQAQAQLDSVLEANADGKPVIHPADKTQIDATKSSLRQIEVKLAELSEKYTQSYLDLDPAIVAQQQKAKRLKKQLEEQIKTSQEEYLRDSQRALSAAIGKVEQLSTQLIEQDKLAQVFSQNLEQYKRLDDDLQALQSSAQTLKNQQVAQQVSKPFEAKISIIEPAFIPDFAIAPNYQLHSLYSLLAAFLLAILALLLFSFIVKQKPTGTANHYVVIPNQVNSIDYMQHSQSARSNQGILPEAQQTPALQQIVRLLSKEECQQLYSVANNQGKAMIGLILSGIGLEELPKITKSSFIDDYQSTLVQGQFCRNLELHSTLAETLRTLCEPLSDEQIIWSNISNQEDFAQLLINAGHDAQLTYPEQLSLEVLRHTYLTYLVTQGCKLNDLELLAGLTPPSELARYRQVNQHGKVADVSQIQSQYPFV